MRSVWLDPAPPSNVGLVWDFIVKCDFFRTHLNRGFGCANASPILKTVYLTKLKAALLLTTDDEFNLYLTYIL